MELWRIGNSPAAPKFNIVAQPNEWTRSVKQNSKGSSLLRAETGLQHQRFWEQLHDHLSKTNSPVVLEEAKPKQWLRSSTSAPNFLVAASRASKRIRVDMRCLGDNRLVNLDLLKQQREAIETEIGEPLVWPGTDKFGLVILRNQQSVDLTDESIWPGQVEWMADALERFDRVLGPRIQEIATSEE